VPTFVPELTPDARSGPFGGLNSASERFGFDLAEFS